MGPLVLGAWMGVIGPISQETQLRPSGTRCNGPRLLASVGRKTAQAAPAPLTLHDAAGSSAGQEVSALKSEEEKNNRIMCRLTIRAKCGGPRTFHL